MYPITGKKVNKFELVKKINAYIAKLEKKVIVMQLIIPVLKSFEGKTVSKRIETKAKEVLKDFTVYYAVGYVEHELKIWGNGIDYDNMITIRLCRNDGNKLLKMEYIFEYDNWYSFQDHIDKLKSFEKEIDIYVKSWNTMVDYLESKAGEFKDIPYPISEDFYMRNLIK